MSHGGVERAERIHVASRSWCPGKCDSMPYVTPAAVAVVVLALLVLVTLVLVALLVLVTLLVPLLVVMVSTVVLALVRVGQVRDERGKRGRVRQTLPQEEPLWCR